MTPLTQAAFARHLGVVKSYVTLLKQQGRLVMTHDGKVDVEASEAKIKATEDPGKSGVAERHSKNREAGQGATAPADAPITAVDAKKAAKIEAPEEAAEPETAGSPDYQKARARKETANADLAEMEARSRAGQLMETAAVLAAIADAGTTLRTFLQTIPPILAPQLATMADENQIRLLLEDQIEQSLSELTTRLAAMAKETA